MPAKDRYSIVTLPGDGIGPEVTAQAVGVLKVAAEKHGGAVVTRFPPEPRRLPSA